MKDGSLCCSFCHKTQKHVQKLISSPRDYPRAYICDECVTVCMAILEDGKATPEPVTSEDTYELNPLLKHPLASALMDAVVNWVRQESLGHPASEELAQVRAIARGIVAS